MSFKRHMKKQTQNERINQIGRVQTEMWIKLSIISKELRKIQDRLGITEDVDDDINKNE